MCTAVSEFINWDVVVVPVKILKNSLVWFTESLFLIHCYHFISSWGWKYHSNIQIIANYNKVSAYTWSYTHNVHWGIRREWGILLLAKDEGDQWNCCTAMKWAIVSIGKQFHMSTCVLQSGQYQWTIMYLHRIESCGRKSHLHEVQILQLAPPNITLWVLKSTENHHAEQNWAYVIDNL